MTQPRRVVPDTTYLLSRRTVLRQFYLVPSDDLEAIYLYALAAAQRKHGFLIHGFTCMSNHVHEVITDVRGVLSDAMGDVRREIANAVKRLHGIPESIFANTKASAVELLTQEAVLDAVAYTILNPVQAGLVARAADWPGAISRPGTRTISVARPPYWFAKTRPATLTLTITPPPSWDRSEDAWHEWLSEHVADAEQRIRSERDVERRGFVGAERVLAHDPRDQPTEPEEPEPTLHPCLAASDGVTLRIAIAQLREWRRAYREARARWLLDKSAAFPIGTWWAVRRAGASTA